MAEARIDGTWEVYEGVGEHGERSYWLYHPEDPPDDFLEDDGLRALGAVPLAEVLKNYRACVEALCLTLPFALCGMGDARNVAEVREAAKRASHKSRAALAEYERLLGKEEK